MGLHTQDVRSPAPRESSRKGELLKVVKCSLNHLEERAVLSVIFLIAIVFVAVSRISEKVAVEGKMKGFMTLMTLFIVLVLLIDVTNLTPEIKSALAWGLSMGIGISMGVFTAWFFFHDILSKKG